MKKLLIVSNLVWMAVFVMAFKSEPATQQNNCSKSCYDYSHQGLTGIISYEKAEAMARHYREYAGPEIFGNPQKDATSIWFSLETIKKFIWAIETNTCKNGCKEDYKQKLGMRIYYGRYKSGMSNVNPDFIDKHSLFMVPTFDNNKGHHIDFNPLSTDYSTNCTLKPLDKSGRRAKMLIMDPTYNQNGTAQNMGCLDPPGCPEGRAF